MSLQSPPDFTPAELHVKEQLQSVRGAMVWVSPDPRESKDKWVLSVDIENKGRNFDCTMIKPLNRLYALRILGGNTVRKSLAVLPRLPKLDLFVATGTGLDDADLIHIGKCKSLNKLDIGGEHVSGAGLKQISGVRTLRRLFLYNTKIKDADLAPLEKMTFLDQLVLPKTVTEGALEALAHKLKHTQVSQ
ncbi:MAG: hypothetical protein BGO01_11295 [Armatimonadetes bacterium 55-13]|nr:MAG: hypothetical protein BGO01_11295 [Armatimonadetes bacterium 55-13]